MTVRVDMELVRRLYQEEGLSLLAIAQRINVLPRTLRNHMTAAGITLRPKGNHTGTQTRREGAR